MDEGTIAVVLNPRAGRGAALALLPEIAAGLRDLGLPLRLHLTRGRGDATAIARDLALQKTRIVVAVGGDGTANEVANGLLAAGGRTALGLIPAGRGNDFVRSSGVSSDVRTALARFASGGCRPVDIGRVTAAGGASRVFLNHAGLGLDARIAMLANASRLPGTTLPYLAGVAGALARHRNIEMTIDVDGQRLEGRVCFVLAANGSSIAGGMRLAPRASVADGLLDLLVVGDIGRLDLLRQVPRVYHGTHLGHPQLRLFPARAVRIEAAEAVPVELEGELFGTAPVTLTVEPGALLLAGTT